MQFRQIASDFDKQITTKKQTKDKDNYQCLIEFMNKKMKAKEMAEGIVCFTFE